MLCTKFKPIQTNPFSKLKINKLPISFLLIKAKYYAIINKKFRQVQMIAFLIIFSIIIISLVIFLLCNFTQRKYDKFIIENSISLIQLKEINSRYNFYPYISFDQHHTYDNEKFYNTISCADYLIYQLQFIRKDILSQIEKTNSNKQQYSRYLDEVKTINQFGQFHVPIGKFKLDKLIKREKRLVEKQTLCEPCTRFSLTVTLYCSKINGQVYDRKYKNFSAADIATLIKRLNNKSGNFYNDRGIWDALCRVERGKVSNKMRFSIYERDGYRCRKCGISDRYTQLEIDHIIPIAKGGKTTYDNLQTLCHSCNVEKGDRL